MPYIFFCLLLVVLFFLGNTILPYITHSIRTARYNILQKSHNVHTVRSNEEITYLMNQPNPTKSIFFYDRQEACVLQHTYLKNGGGGGGEGLTIRFATPQSLVPGIKSMLLQQNNYSLHFRCPLCTNRQWANI